VPPISSRAFRAFFAWAFLLIALAFTSATFISQRSATRIHTIVEDVRLNAEPSLEHLTRARTILWELQLRLMRVRGEVADGQPVNLDWANRALASFENEWSAYADTRELAADLASRRQLGADFARMEAVTASVAAALRERDFAGAAQIIDHDASRAFDKAGLDLVNLSQLYMRLADEAAARVEEVRRHTGRMAYALDGLAAALTLIVASLLAATMRRHTRLETENKRLLQKRTTDLEQFASIVAHDIRGPLATATLRCEYALRLEQDRASKRGQLIDHVLTSLKRTSLLVDGLYEFARAGVASAANARASLREAVAFALEEEEPHATTAGISLKAEEIPDCAVAAAPGSVASVLLNLLENALKYAGAGASVTVRASARDKVHVEVEDNGPGIPVEAQAQIFEPFKRGTDTTPEGLGLGLATVTRLVTRHRGACGVRSAVGHGSVFWFELPLASTAPAES